MPLRITIESNALTGDAWSVGVVSLLELARDCDSIDVKRTAGTLRESSRPHWDATANVRRSLALSVPALDEAFRLDVSELDGAESVLATDVDQVDSDAISRALWGRDIGTLGDPSKVEDVAHLQTHLRHARDLFVTTDRRILKRRDSLARIGIHVASPEDALGDALEACHRPNAGV